MTATNWCRECSAEIINKELHMIESHEIEWDDRGVEERAESDAEFRFRLAEQYRVEREKARARVRPVKHGWLASFKAACIAVMGS